MIHHEKLRQYRLAMELVPYKMGLEEGRVDAMNELYKRYPGALNADVVACIAEVAELPMTEWLYERSVCCSRSTLGLTSRVLGMPQRKVEAM